MTIGYMIIAHHKPQQLVRLVRNIRAQSEGPIIVHLDRKSAHKFGATIPEFLAARNVRVISTRQVGWGDFSIVLAALDCISELCVAFPELSYIKHLSGQDYPIKPIAKFEQMMESRGELSSMEIHRLPRAELGAEGGLDRVQYLYIRRARRFAVRLPFKRHLPEGVTFYAGSQFWCLSLEHCRYVLAESVKWTPLFRRALIPDEVFFHTILMNSVFSKDLINEDITYAQWESDAASPSLLGMKDIQVLLRSDCYFARKFDIDRDTNILDELDGRLQADRAN